MKSFTLSDIEIFSLEELAALKYKYILGSSIGPKALSFNTMVKL
jgi:hypothetical protein